MNSAMSAVAFRLLDGSLARSNWYMWPTVQCSTAVNCDTMCCMSYEEVGGHLVCFTYKRRFHTILHEWFTWTIAHTVSVFDLCGYCGKRVCLDTAKRHRTKPTLDRRAKTKSMHSLVFTSLITELQSRVKCKLPEFIDLYFFLLQKRS